MNNFGEEIDDVTDYSLDYRTAINKFFEFYARKDINTIEILVESFYTLQGARLGIRVDDVKYK